MNSTVNQRILYQIGISAIIFFGIPFVVSGGRVIPFDYVYRVQIFIGIAIMIILNLKILFPRFYHFNRFRVYLLITIGCIFFIRIASIFLFETNFETIYENLPSRFDGTSRPKLSANQLKFIQVFIGSIPLFIVTLASTLYEISILTNQTAKETALLKAEKLEAELKFLKSQINPHFLFNSLNNIYTLTVLDPKSAGKSLLKLSEMLRYLLYECDAEKVPLERELTYLQNYIDLFSLKDDEGLNINFDAKDVNSNVMIAPLLFIPFVENAFKHSQIEDLENGWINISIIGDNEQIYFEIKNSVPKLEFSKDDLGGIGLQNVKRQLELLYPNQHNLYIQQKDEQFEVSLMLKMSNF